MGGCGQPVGNSRASGAQPAATPQLFPVPPEVVRDNLALLPPTTLRPAFASSRCPAGPREPAQSPPSPHASQHREEEERAEPRVGKPAVPRSPGVTPGRGDPTAPQPAPLPAPGQARWSKKVLRGLQALSAAAGSIPDPDGAVARARAWIAAREASGGRRAVPEPDGRRPHAQAVELLVELWESAHGRRYPFAPRDAAAVSRLRKMPDWSLEEASRRFSVLLRDEWWRRRGVAIPDLEGQWARLASSAGGPRRSKATEAADWLARRMEGQ